MKLGLKLVYIVTPLTVTCYNMGHHISLFLLSLPYISPNLAAFLESVVEIRIINIKQRSWQTGSGRDLTMRSGFNLL